LFFTHRNAGIAAGAGAEQEGRGPRVGGPKPITHQVKKGEPIYLGGGKRKVLMSWQKGGKVIQQDQAKQQKEERGSPRRKKPYSDQQKVGESRKRVKEKK